jgi:Uma2 family endonuclease
LAVPVELSELHRLSRDEFQQLVDSGALEDVRVELIDGLLVDMSPPSPEHDAVIVFLNAPLVRALDGDRYQSNRRSTRPRESRSTG